MTRRALLVGSQTYGLAGCDADVTLMGEALRRRGFEAIDIRIGQDATRGGIIDGFERLIGATGPTDAVVVYYSGHGGRVARPDADARRNSGSSASFQFIVPYDIDESEEGDFRGLLSEELTILQQRLTDAFTRAGASPNVTVILDCCHSGYLVRDADLRPKSIAVEPKMFRMMGIRARAEQLVGAGGLVANPHAVRLVACQEEQSAFERSERARRTPRRAHGLTGHRARRDRRPRGVVGGRRRRRAASGPGHGARPASRRRRTLDALLFSPARDESDASFPVARRDDTLVIEAAAVLGVSIGDRFALRAAGADGEIGQATVTAVADGDARLAATWSAGIADVSVGIRAVPRHMSLARRRIAVDVGGPAGAGLARRIDETSRLTTDTQVGPVFATVVHDGGLVVLDDAGARMRTAPEPHDDAGLQRVVDLLEELARARSLRELASGTGSATLEQGVAMRFVTARDGAFAERPPHGERLAAGDRVNLTVQNLSDGPLYFWVFDVGISGRTTLVTDAGPSGSLLAPRSTPGDTAQIWGADGGVLEWPPDVPTGPSTAEGIRSESFVIITADRRQDLSALGTPPERTRGVASTSLDALSAEVRSGVRGTPAAARFPMRHRVDTIDFFVLPEA